EGRAMVKPYVVDIIALTFLKVGGVTATRRPGPAAGADLRWAGPRALHVVRDGDEVVGATFDNSFWAQGGDPEALTVWRLAGVIDLGPDNQR
ncbi:MAG: hypothetical protein ABIL09_16065, partial [Gemmatimonadota bacterium]